MQRRCVYDENTETSTAEDTREVIVVFDDLPAKGERELRFDCIDLEQQTTLLASSS